MSNTQTSYRRLSARCHETSRTLFSTLLWPLALSSPHLNRRRRYFSHLAQLQSLLATASPAKRIYATALAVFAPSDRVVAAMARLLCYVWLTQNGLPNYPQVEPKLTQKINGSALNGTYTIFYFWVLGSWVKPTKTASLILILVLHDLIDIYVEYCATT